MGALEYFGQDETLAGETAGKRLAAEGAKNVVCVIQEQGSVALEARCAGVKAGMGSAGAVQNLNVTGTDLPSVESTIGAKLQQDPSIDYIVTLGAPIALTAVKSVGNTGSKAKVGTFDTNAALVAAVKDGSVQWAIDQQPYLQGYLAIDSLWLYLNNKNVIGGGQADIDRSGLHRQDQHRFGGRAGRSRNPLARGAKGNRKVLMTTQADLDLETHKVVHDERVKEQNRLQRLLIRPRWARSSARWRSSSSSPSSPRRSAAPRPWPRCCTPARRSASWPSRSGC